LSESRFGSRLIEGRVFLVVLVFSVISAITGTLMLHISYYLSRIGYSVVDVALIVPLLSGMTYLVNPILYFVVLYMTCRGPLLNRIASVLASIILAGLVGYCIGGLVGAVVSATLLGTVPAVNIFFNIVVYSLPQYTFGALLFAFAVLAFSDITANWTKALMAQGLQRTRPGGVVLITVLYVVFAFLNVLAIPFLFIYAVSPSVKLLTFVILAVLSGLSVAGQLILAAGLYLGKRWAWVIVLITSGGGIVVDASALGSMILFDLFISSSLLLIGLLVGLFLGFLVCIAIFSYLLGIGARRFFGFVNPVAETQDMPAEGTRLDEY
jgi:hypothetical protein